MEDSRPTLATAQASAGPTVPVWRENRLRRFLADLAYPLIWLLNRPALAPVSRAIYDFALRCNGIAINFKGDHGLTVAEEKLLARVAPGLGRGVVLDVGANTGAYALTMRRLAPEAQIYAFEPHPSTYAILARRVGPSGVHALNLALGEAEGSVELYDFGTADGSTQASLSRASMGLYTDNIVAHPVSCTTIDAFLEEKGIATVDYLKIDTEGFDLNVLRGARRSLEERRIKMIQFEFIAANIATSVRMRDFFDVLTGYRIYRVCLNGQELPIFPYSVKYNEIFVNHNLIARLH